MATIAQILPRKWPGETWTIDNDTYAKLQWFSKTTPKPTEAEIRAFSAEVDAAIAAENAKITAQDKFLRDNPDAVLKLAELTFDGFASLYAVLSGAQKTALQGDQNFQALVAARTRLTQLRSG